MFSLYPTKNMTSGEGGMVSTADADVARNLRLLRNQGMERQYENEVVGFNARMTDIHAAIGRVQLTKVCGWTEQRQAERRVPDANLEGVVTPPVADGRRARLPPVHDPRRRGPRRPGQGAARGAQRRHRRLLPGPEPPSAVVQPRPRTCPNTETAAQEVLSLPVHPSLSQDDLERIVDRGQQLVKAGA